MDPGARPVQEWRKQSFDFTADSTKQLITVAAGVVTATVLFSKDLDAISRGLAYASWIALIFSVMFCLRKGIHRESQKVRKGERELSS